MSKFSAADAAEPLDYDFAPYADVRGTIPEPTDDEVAEFYGNLSRQLELALGPERTADVDMTDPEQVGALFLSLNADDNRKLYDALLDVHAGVCGGQPDRDAIAALPFRLRRAFYGAVQGWLRPEASRPATNA